MKKKLVILFNGPHLSYSPTTIGLYDELSHCFDVTIVAQNPKYFNNKPLPNKKVFYLNRLDSRNDYWINKVRSKVRAVFDKDVGFLRKNKVGPDFLYEFVLIKDFLIKEKPDLIIAVDFRNLWYTEILKKEVEFLSLEIDENDEFYKRCSFENIDSVVIQTKERYEHLFDDRKLKTFFVQNAPVYQDASIINNHSRKGLIYCGTAWNAFGFYHCLNFLEQFPEYTLNVKGALLDDDRTTVETKYQNLLSNKRVMVDDAYLDEKQLTNYLRRFRIGFCFYNFEVEWVNKFNYYSAPSGKMFKYLAAGVPVVGQNILGLNPVKEFDCGVLIEDLTPDSIKRAIDKIENNFDYYSSNCLAAAKHYSFDKMTKPFVEYLKNLSNQTK